MGGDQVKDLERAEAEYLASRVDALQKVPGNPYQAATIQIGEQTCFLVARNASPMNSRICGVDLDAPVLPKSVLDKFAKADVKVCIPVIGKPAEVKARAAVMGATPLRGWTHGQFVADMAKLPEISTVHHTRRLKSTDVEKFVEIHSKEFGISKTAYGMALDMFRGLLETRRTEAYAVEIDDMLVAIGLIYFTKDKIAYLATAATSKSARKQGAHTSLIACRIAAARNRGAQRIFSTALLNSQSRRNLQKAGLSLSHVQTIVTV